jgi:hypothetical protein
VLLESPPNYPEIADMLDNLVLDENLDEFVGSGKEHN